MLIASVIIRRPVWPEVFTRKKFPPLEISLARGFHQKEVSLLGGQFGQRFSPEGRFYRRSVWQEVFTRRKFHYSEVSLARGFHQKEVSLFGGQFGKRFSPEGRSK